MSDTTERLMAEFNCIEPVYVDGIAGLLNLGPNFATLYFRWVPAQSEGGAFIYQQTPAITLVRPTASIITESQHRAMLGCYEPPPRGNIVRMTGTH